MSLFNKQSLNKLLSRDLWTSKSYCRAKESQWDDTFFPTKFADLLLHPRHPHPPRFLTVYFLSLYTFSHSFRLLPLVLKFKLSFNIFGFINGEFNYQTPPCILPGTTLTLEITVTYPPAGANVNLFGLGGGFE